MFEPLLDINIKKLNKNNNLQTNVKCLYFIVVLTLNPCLKRKTTTFDVPIENHWTE